MKIIANGEPIELPEELTLLQLLIRLQVGLHTAVLEHNGEIIPRDKWSTLVRDGDKIEILQFLGGG